MGFLTGGYLKMYSARLRLQLQHQLTSITMRHNKIQKQVGEMEKRLTQMQQSQTSMCNAQMQADNAGLYQSIFTGLNAEDANAVQMANARYQRGQQLNAVLYQQSKFMQENSFEEIRQMQLEPLQQLEERLAIEKANLETRVATVKEQEDSAKQMEKQDRKDAVADYTGQG